MNIENSEHSSDDNLPAKKYTKKHLNETHLKYLFGNIPNLNQLKYDNISIYSITPKNLADEITEKLAQLSHKILNKPVNQTTITEMTACIGGNVISFANKFKYVHAIELCEERYNYLNHNINVLGIKNVNSINGDSLVEIKNLRQDIIFFDIPWGGRKYKYREKINLYISKIPSYDACNMVKQYTKIICMKIPNNFNIEKFRNKVDMTIYSIIDLKKFQLVILI